MIISWYHSGLIWDARTQATWLGEKFQDWAEKINTLAGVLLWTLHAAYIGLHNPLQQKWDFCIAPPRN